MRLDHLLSKEHLERRAACASSKLPAARTNVPWPATLTSGTSTIWLSARVLVSTTGSPEWNLEEEWSGSGTLLSPEGSSIRSPRRAIFPANYRPDARSGRSARSRGWLRPLLENYTVDASIFSSERQATKGTWWMPWHQEPMKDVGACDKPREVGNRAVIRGFPNGETQLESCPATSA